MRKPKKPDPEVFSKRIAPLFPTATPANCIGIGDTATDLEFARNIGASACFAAYGFGDRASCDRFGYTHKIASLGDLVEIYGQHPRL